MVSFFLDLFFSSICIPGMQFHLRRDQFSGLYWSGCAEVQVLQYRCWLSTATWAEHADTAYQRESAFM